MEKLLGVAEITISYKPSKNDKPVISKSVDAFNIFKPFFSEDSISLQEQFAVMYLNRANKVLGVHIHSKGGITGTVADPRLILSTALLTASTSIILCHNHPSGNLKPSRADEELTQKIKEAGKFLEIKVLDHLIISDGDEFLSMADEGLI